MPGPVVMYDDYNGIFAPLAELYWSSSSGVLVSRHPSSSVEEVISMYCPHCLTRYMEEEAINYQGRCPVCFQCPQCANVLVTAAIAVNGEEGSKAALTCSACHYRCGLAIGADKQDIDAIILEKERESLAGEAFLKIQSHLQQRNADAPSLLPPPPHPPIPAADLPESPLPSTETELLDIRQRTRTGWTQPLSLSDCVPPRVKLRSKRTRRCRLDVESSKMSIIAQPKTFPLEGDSSLKIQRGKWWVKDSSAIHEVPRLVITKLPLGGKNEDEGVLHLELTNPKDIPVTVTLACAASSPLQVAGNAAPLEIVLGPYEDELLREGGSGADEVSAEDKLVALLATDPAVIGSGWVVALAFNSAALAVPLRLEQSPGGPSVLELQLTLASMAAPIHMKVLL